MTTTSLPLDVVAGLALLAAAPFAIVATTSFVRIVIVLSLVRSAIGAPSLPPNAALTSLALVLTFAVMTPVAAQIERDALQPYAHKRLTQSQLVARAFVPLRAFMLRQTHARDVRTFERLSHRPHVPLGAEPPAVVLPAFIVGELRSAFAIGFALYLPFVAIDLAVAAILMGLGMFMLSPPIVSLPCKLLLFVMVDGWTLVCGGLISSFR
ncbi:MAG: EscR/YscR/HrcR family type III secretion system export apparatus protein [Candidatus Eremiobacteraeota bacterium]|nr:EscR/YscR/HrcR family type III secretion system export apparatus protein [Candidatus Eremiobacteraeota bacterium]